MSALSRTKSTDDVTGTTKHATTPPRPTSTLWCAHCRYSRYSDSEVWCPTQAGTR